MRLSYPLAFCAFFLCPFIGTSQTPLDGTFQLIWNDEFSTPTVNVNHPAPIDVSNKWFKEYYDAKRTLISHDNLLNPDIPCDDVNSHNQFLSYRGPYGDSSVLFFDSLAGTVTQRVVADRVTIHKEELAANNSGSGNYWLDKCCYLTSNPHNGHPDDSVACLPDSATFDFKSSTAFNSRQAFKYGFFETRVRLSNLPEFRTGSQNSNSGIGANFWLFTAKNPLYKDPLVTYSEIDIFEFVCRNDSQNNVYTYNRHFSGPASGNSLNSIATVTGGNEVGYVDFSDFHKFAVDWTPTYVRYFFDDQMVYQDNEFSSDLNPMHIILDINFTTYGEEPTIHTLYPYDFEIDYVRVYKHTFFDPLNCVSPSFNACDPSGIGVIYENINIGGGGCNIIVSNPITPIRATNSIVLDGGVSFNLGSELLIEIQECHEPQITQTN